MPHAVIRTPAYMDTIVGMVLYHDLVRRGIIPNMWMTCGFAHVTAQESVHA